jgi:hypothetical protein
MSSLPGSCGKFHLKDGRPVVFHCVRRSNLRRRAGEALALAFVLIAAAFAASLLTASRSPRPSLHSETRGAPVP